MAPDSAPDPETQPVIGGTTVAMATILTTGDGDERFEFGLDVLLRGLKSLREG